MTGMADDASTLAALRQRVEVLERRLGRVPDPDSLAMVIFSGELDKLLAGFVIATGAAACGMQVTMFFTFWGTAALKKAGRQSPGKTLVERAFGWLLPGGWSRRRLSRLDMGGLGRRLMLQEMKRKNVADLETLMQLARDSGVKLLLCEMSMSLMGIRVEEIIDYPGLQVCGVAHFVDVSARANTTLFI